MTYQYFSDAESCKSPGAFSKSCIKSEAFERPVVERINAVLGLPEKPRVAPQARDSVPASLWSRDRFLSTPVGNAARITEPSIVPYSVVRRNCQPDKGSIFPAGTKRWRSMGIYEGSLASRGDSAKFCSFVPGAPCQDHLTLDCSAPMSEFPRGRRTYPVPSYLKRNPLLLL